MLSKLPIKGAYDYKRTFELHKDILGGSFEEGGDSLKVVRCRLSLSTRLQYRHTRHQQESGRLLKCAVNNVGTQDP